jgi:2-haloacid dehalogenase
MQTSLLPPRAKAVIFDAYGTLFDVHAAVARHADGIGPDAARLSEVWRAKQLEYSWVLSLAGQYEPFWSLTEKALDYAFARFPGVDRSIRPLLLDAYRSLDAFPEVKGALAALKQRGLRTGILSNGDPGMLNAAVASADLGSSLDAVLSVDAAGVFKTSPATYQLALKAFCLKANEVMFVSSNRWDIAGAAAFGFAPIWVNRLGMPDEYTSLKPILTVKDLRALGKLMGQKS